MHSGAQLKRQSRTLSVTAAVCVLCGSPLLGDQVTDAPTARLKPGTAPPKALLTYNVSKAPELSNPMDPTSAPTGSTCYVLAEVYETGAGVADHFKQAGESWADFPAFVEWLEKCDVTVVPAAEIFTSLW